MTTLMPVGPEGTFHQARQAEEHEDQRDDRGHHQMHADRLREARSCPVSRIIVAMAPGPAISGMASGKTDGSSARLGRPGVHLILAPRRAPLEQHVERGEEQQDAARDAEGGHRDADEAQHRLAEHTEERQAAPRPSRRRGWRWRGAVPVMPCVSATKSGASPNGSITTKSVTKAVTKNGDVAHASAASSFSTPPSRAPRRGPAHRSSRHISSARPRSPQVRRVVDRGSASRVASFVAHLLQLLDALSRFCAPRCAAWRARSRLAARRGLRGFVSRAGLVRLGQQIAAIALQIAAHRRHPPVLHQPEPVGHEARAGACRG